MPRFVVVALLAGCGWHGSDGGIPSDGLVDVAISLPDRDQDLVPDEIDNCPDVPNSDQGNVDSDPWGDACDGCPPWITGSEDRDGDGVFDLCDPYPDEPGDQIALVEPFRTIDHNRWIEIGGWVVDASGLRATPSTVAPSLLISEQAFDYPTIEISFQAGQFTLPRPGANRWAIEAWSGASLDADQRLTGIRCQVALQDDRVFAAQLHHVDSSGASLLATNFFPLEEFQNYRFRVVTGTESRCLTTDFLHYLEQPDTVGLPLGRVAIGAQGIGLHVNVLVVYTRTAPPTPL